MRTLYEHACGVTVNLVRVGDEYLHPDQHGHLARQFRAGDEILLGVTTPKGWHALSVDRDREVKEVEGSYLPEFDRVIFYHRVEVRETDDGTPYAAYPSNKLRLIRVDERGFVTVFYVTIQSQNGHFFLVPEEGYPGKELRIYRYAGEYRIPEITWKGVERVLARAFKGRENQIPALRNFAQEDDDPDVSHLDRRGSRIEGIVLFWDNGSQTGAILTPAGKAKVHWTQVPEDEAGRAYLAMGEYVTCRLRNSRVRKSNFAFDALDVELLDDEEIKTIEKRRRRLGRSLATA